MPEENENSLVSHLEALRRMLLRIVIATALLYPAGYVLTPYAIDALVCWCCPPEIGKLHYFAPMEVFFVHLKLALILALAMAYPWNIFQLWRFLLPALYKEERRALGWVFCEQKPEFKQQPCRYGKHHLTHDIRGCQDCCNDQDHGHDVLAALAPVTRLVAKA